MVRSLILFSMVLALLVGGCAPATLPAAAPDSQTATGEPSPQPTAPSAAAPVDATEPNPLSPTPKVRTGLEATDPTTVAVGAGTPVLLEFFAFW